MTENATTIYRFRKQRGVNLGSWFVLERWITESPFRQAAPPAQSDYDVARGSSAKQILEQHWDAWITSDDWKWMNERGINSVRIPIGFYHLCGLDQAVLDGTDFQPFCGTFEGAWRRIAQAIFTARQHGIGVLLDLHAAPGKQNGDAHSGQTGSVRFYEEHNLSATLRALRLLVSYVKDIPNVVGVQLVNEPQNHARLPPWYSSTLGSLRSITPNLPLYIHDAWDTHQYAELAGSRNYWVIVDHHLYRCFTSDDSHKSGDEHAKSLRDPNQMTWFSEAANKCRGNLVVAEFSAALNPGSLHGDVGEQDRLRRVFTRAQLDLYERICGGWWFWTLKKEAGWDAGWNLKNATTAAIMPEFYGMKRLAHGIQRDTDKRDREAAKALHDHTIYWSRHPGHYEYWRFSDGFRQGWDDAYTFFTFGEGPSISEIGFEVEWIKMRREQHAANKGQSSNLWEFEHGLA
ncbi:glycoside hydrolase [Dacryopinax primogenitus]|uniref:Glycoside hydrolase n=1 Tax=Dacryopinax primogenitus (strain DJM 731) TaxID=1858805 RepID=M5FSR5_DACPD|nr:glycoside hydrolase [Dacryopinax primogenitus]EJT98284.1 glycoside hydrolase [Dacryopinax primogenitus]